jgi:hypothetical protein
MRVDPRFTPQTAGTAAPGRPVPAGAAFSLAGAAATTVEARAPTAPGVPATALASADALILLQGGGESGEERRRRSAKRGHDLLDALDRLKAALVVGRVATADLKAIAARLSERAETSGDPRLDEIVAHIRLRAEVELAKLAAAEGRVA